MKKHILISLAILAIFLTAFIIPADVKEWGQDCWDTYFPYGIKADPSPVWSGGTRYITWTCYQLNGDGNWQYVWSRVCSNPNPKVNLYPTTTPFRAHLSCWRAP